MDDGDDEASFYECYCKRFCSYPNNLIGNHYSSKYIQACSRYHGLYAPILFPQVRRDIEVEIRDYGNGRMGVCSKSRISVCGMWSVSDSGKGLEEVGQTQIGDKCFVYTT